MIVSKTPLRMSFVGGGSDLAEYYSYKRGAVLSTTINKYIYVIVNKKFDNKIRLSYNENELVEKIEDIKHPLIREVLNDLDINNSIEIVSVADIPSKGSGLGSSSSFTVGLINALKAFKNEQIQKIELGKMACDIEINKCQQPIGKQDQYAAALGGLNLIEFQSNGDVNYNKINCKLSTLENLQENILMFYTGKTRSASEILKSQGKESKKTEKRLVLDRMVDLVYDLKNELENDNLDSFGEILNENWQLKKSLTNNISNSHFDNIYDEAINNGATGGKLLGAGNGGFFIFYAPKKNHRNIIKSLNNLKLIDFKFDDLGSQILIK